MYHKSTNYRYFEWLEKKKKKIVITDISARKAINNCEERLTGQREQSAAMSLTKEI